MNLLFTDEEKVQFLRKHGCTVSLELVTMGCPSYHNQMDWVVTEVYIIREPDGKVHRPSGYLASSSREEALDSAFHDVLKRRMLSGL